MIARTALTLVAILVAASAAAAKPQIQWNQEYDFENVGTFQWRSPGAETLAQSDPFLHSRIVNAIEYQLTSAGLTEVASNPDIYVTYYASSETSVSLRSSSVGYSFGGYGMSGWGRYGYSVGGPISTTTRVVETERGTLVVDVWDAASNELVWRGVASGITISDSAQKNEKNAVKAIHKMAEQYRKLRARQDRRS